MRCIDLTLERHRDLLRRGAVLVDERDPGTSPRVLFFLEHAIQDASVTKSGERRVVSKRLLYVEIDAQGAARHLNYAPYLDYRPLADGRAGDRRDPGSARVRMDQPRPGEQGAGSRDRRRWCRSIWPRCATASSSSSTRPRRRSRTG